MGYRFESCHASVFTYSVFDDFIPDYHQDCIENELQRMKWEYNPNISSVPLDPSIEVSDNQSGFSGNIYSELGKNDIVLGMCLPIIAKATKIIPDNVYLSRIRAGMFTRGNGKHKPHVDYYDPHYTLLYYVNNSDGDTFLFNQFAQDRHYPSSFDEMIRISPQKGRAVIFNGLLYHCSSYPEKNDTRVAININLMIRS